MRESGKMEMRKGKDRGNERGEKKEEKKIGDEEREKK